MATATFLNSRGTTDVLVWERWVANAQRFGIVDGYAANAANYPPLSYLILSGAARILGTLGIAPFDAIKLSLALFLIITSATFWLWTKDVILAAGLHLSLLVSAVALGYLDIFYAPSLLLSLWALRRHRVVPAAVLFTVACLTKPQPLIIAPFIWVYAFAAAPTSVRITRHRRFVVSYVLPSVMTIVLAVSESDPWRMPSYALPRLRRCPDLGSTSAGC